MILYEACVRLKLIKLIFNRSGYCLADTVHALFDFVLIARHDNNVNMNG